MTPETLEREIHEIKEQMNQIMNFIIASDKVSNVLFCQEEHITKQTLGNWFKKGCPRIDNRHISRSQVKKWMATNSTHATAKHRTV